MKRAQTDHCAVQLRAAARSKHTDVGTHRPGFDRHNFSPDREILSNVDGSVDHVVPDGRVVSAVHDINLNFDGSRQGWVSLVLSHSLQLVRFSLCTDNGQWNTQ